MDDDTMVYQTGEKPGRGLYCCTFCKATVTLIHDLKVLPVCTRCKGTRWERQRYF